MGGLPLGGGYGGGGGRKCWRYSLLSLDRGVSAPATGSENGLI